MTNEPTPPAINPRLFRDGDEAPLLQLLEASYSRWPGVEISVPPIEHLRWKLRRDLTPPLTHSVVEVDSRLIAADLTFLLCCKAGKRVLRVRATTDVCVHPSYRGVGVFRRLRAFAMETAVGTMDLHLGSQPIPVITTVTDQRVERRPLANTVQILVRPLTFRSGGDQGQPWTSRLLHSAGYAALVANQAARRRSGRAPMPTSSLRQTSRFDGRIDAFSAEAATAFDFIALRGMDHLNWRYADIRAGNYRITLAEEGDRIVGLGILTVARGRAFIADLLALPDRLDVATSLLADAVESARHAGAAAIECWLPAHHPYQTLLRQASFFRARNAGFFFEPISVEDEAIAFLTDPFAAIHATIGDTDLV